MRAGRPKTKIGERRRPNNEDETRRIDLQTSVASERHASQKRPHTWTDFHLPLRNQATPSTADNEKAVAIAKKMPEGPKLARPASNVATGISQIQKQTKLMTMGVRVSPAPLKAWFTTMPYA